MSHSLPADQEVGEALADGIHRLGLEVTREQQARMLDYIALLARWNRTYNLTAVRDPTEMVPVHLLDSLSIAPYVEGERVLDLGSGPGLPGIPLAVIQPHRRFTLLDANAKKTRFLRQVVAQLALTNVEALWRRAEAYRPALGFDCITARAFGELSDILSLARPLLRQGCGLVLAMKGRRPERPLAESGPMDISVVPLRVPRLDRERHLVLIRINPR